MKKLLITILIFLLFINIFVSSSFCSDTLSVIIDGKNESFILRDGYNETYKKFFIYRYFVTFGSEVRTFYGLVYGNSDIFISGFSETSSVFIGDSEVRPYYQTVSSVKSPHDFNYNNASSYNSSFPIDRLASLEQIVYSNYDIKNVQTNEVIHPSDEFFVPYFMNTQEELASGKFDTLKIDMGDLNHYDDEVIFNIYKGINIGDNLYDYSECKSILLNTSSSYFKAVDLHIQYFIPKEKLGIDISNDKRYVFELKEKGGDTVYSSIGFTIGGLTSDEVIKNAQDLTNDKLDEQTNAIKDQTEVIKEQTETNKNIFEKLGDILSYINPFSENFFVYKLIELLINAIKSLFIPSDDFFSTYFTELKDWFSDRLGFLFYPFELVIDILTKILNVNFNEPIFNVPDINEPFTGNKLISATNFNLNDMVSSGSFKVIHDIYLVCLDAFIVFELVNLFRRKYEEVTTK